MDLHAIYLRVNAFELDELERDPRLLVGRPLQQALDEGRAIDLGRAWEELGAFLQGGIQTPETGPTVGEETILTTEDGVIWNVVRPHQVREYLTGTLGLDEQGFLGLWSVDEADTADFLPGERTGEWENPVHYLIARFHLLQKLYRDAEENGEAVLVRLGPQRRAQRRTD